MRWDNCSVAGNATPVALIDLSLDYSYVVNVILVIFEENRSKTNFQKMSKTVKAKLLERKI